MKTEPRGHQQLRAEEAAVPGRGGAEAGREAGREGASPTLGISQTSQKGKDPGREATH